MKKLKSILFFAFIATPYLAMADASNGSKPAPGIDLTITQLFGILTGLACWMSRFIIVFMTMVIIWYGIQFLLSRGDPSKFKTAKQSLNYAIIGILVVLGANTIIATVGNAVDAAGGHGGQARWKNVLLLNCSSYGATVSNTTN